MLPKPPTSRPNTTHNLALLAASLGNSLSPQRVCVLCLCVLKTCFYFSIAIGWCPHPLDVFWLRHPPPNYPPTPGRKKQFFPKGSFICFISAFDHAQTNNFPFSLECAAAAAAPNGPPFCFLHFSCKYSKRWERVSFGKFRVAIFLLVFVELLCSGEGEGEEMLIKWSFVSHIYKIPPSSYSSAGWGRRVETRKAEGEGGLWKSRVPEKTPGKHWEGN